MFHEGDETRTTTAATPRAAWLPAVVRALRPHQWVKNVLLFSGVIFSRSLTDPQAVLASLIAFGSFCAASSAMYLLNDLRDVDEDRRHPLKRLRPLAAGDLSPAAALLTMVLLVAIALVGALSLTSSFASVLAVYVALNLAYSLGLKKVVVLDVMLIASGFVLRAVAGAVAISVVASPWLVLCTLLLALLVGFGKRRQELTLLATQAAGHRATLDGYTVRFLEQMMGVCAAAAIVSYALYAMAVETVKRFDTQSLVLTTPFVIYGIFRYLYLSCRCDEGGDPARLFLTDRATLINATLWVLSVCGVVYGPRAWLPW